MINGGQILLVEEKDKLMKRLGTKELRIELHEPVSALPESLVAFGVKPADDGMSLHYRSARKAPFFRTGM